MLELLTSPLYFGLFENTFNMKNQGLLVLLNSINMLLPYSLRYELPRLMWNLMNNTAPMMFESTFLKIFERFNYQHKPFQLLSCMETKLSRSV